MEVEANHNAEATEEAEADHHGSVEVAHGDVEADEAAEVARATP